MMMNACVAWITWNPNREIFRIPYLDHPITWYGVLFAAGFMLAFVVLSSMFREKLGSEEKAYQKALSLTDRLTWFVLIGTLIGARLGHVFFYDWPRYRDHPIDIFKIWEGGLASHGGVLAILISLYLFRLSIKKEYPSFTFLVLLDTLCIPAAIGSLCIRIGNFVNQEIYGTATSVPWAVIFANPIDGAPGIPRHPTQLYEAFSLLITFIILYSLWKKKHAKFQPGTFCGLFAIMVFGSRFFIEFTKAPQSMMINESLLTMGQVLSLPFIFVGVLLCCQKLNGCGRLQSKWQ